MNEQQTNKIVLEEQIKDYARTLELVNYQIAELARIKEELEQKLYEKLNHPDEGQKSYVYGKYNITVKSGWIYSLNKDEYEVISDHIPAIFNPVEIKESYHINKSIIRNAEKYASKEELDLLSQIIEKKPSKINVKITPAT